jgi:hypothetical protein
VDEAEVTPEQNQKEYEQRRKAEAEYQRWLAVKTNLKPEERNAIIGACRHMAEQYRKDMVATHMPESDRVSDQFHKQAKLCEMIVDILE